MLCRVEMPTNEQIFGRFYRWRLINRGGGSAKVTYIALPILSLVVAFFMWSAGMSLVVAGAMLAVVFGFIGYSMWIKPGMIFRKKGGVALQTEVFIFTETGFTRSVRSEEGGMPENTSSQYDVLVSAAETGSDFYLFTSMTQAYLVDKEYFTKGSPEELREVLRKKLGKKFTSKQ